MHAERMSENMLHEHGLIEQAKRGDERSFNQLVSLWYKRIYNFNYKLCAEPDITADVTQQTFIAAYKHLVKLKDNKSFRPWIYRIATNFCYQEGRKISNRKAINFSSVSKDDSEQAFLNNNAASGALYNPERGFQQSELESILLDCLQELPEEQRTVIIMKEYEGMKFHEIADALNASENTVKTRLYRGLKVLKEQLDNRKITKETIHYEL